MQHEITLAATPKPKPSRDCNTGTSPSLLTPFIASLRPAAATIATSPLRVAVSEAGTSTTPPPGPVAKCDVGVGANILDVKMVRQQEELVQQLEAQVRTTALVCDCATSYYCKRQFNRSVYIKDIYLNFWGNHKYIYQTQVRQCRADAEKAALVQADKQKAELELAQETNQSLAGQLAATEANSGVLLEQIRSLREQLQKETQMLEDAKAQVSRYAFYLRVLMFYHASCES